MDTSKNDSVRGEPKEGMLPHTDTQVEVKKANSTKSDEQKAAPNESMCWGQRAYESLRLNWRWIARMLVLLVQAFLILTITLMEIIEIARLLPPWLFIWAHA